MHIEIVKKEERKNTLSILIDEEPWGDIHTSIFGMRPKFPLEADTLSEWEQQFYQLEHEQAKRYVLKRLSERAFHSAELVKALKERHVSEQTADQIIQKCFQLGFLNDEEWVDRFIQGQLRRRYSLKAIAQKLHARGISSEIAKKATHEHKNPATETASIVHLLNTRYQSRNLQERREKEKVIASLMRKGFSFASIKEAMGKSASTLAS